MLLLVFAILPICSRRGVESSGVAWSVFLRTYLVPFCSVPISRVVRAHAHFATDVPFPDGEATALMPTMTLF